MLRTTAAPLRTPSMPRTCLPPLSLSLSAHRLMIPHTPDVLKSTAECARGLEQPAGQGMHTAAPRPRGACMSAQWPGQRLRAESVRTAGCPYKSDTSASYQGTSSSARRAARRDPSRTPLSRRYCRTSSCAITSASVARLPQATRQPSSQSPVRAPRRAAAFVGGAVTTGGSAGSWLGGVLAAFASKAAGRSAAAFSRCTWLS
mmetsp:Transcript_26426/g.85371  ORF Transcript_26426/g.85371 Transcript_26426/m.85371 type:complete len:203 (-) Transcript_26426:792-1400(-)|eukprot:scaffold9330_cov117-Isochrysis_galbana.AAC.14